MKKMRKLIPAFAMLMVAAIMMTTASFAWFTMNSEVTATGMQIQAQADSSLVIGASPLTADGGAPKLPFASTTVNKLIPMTYNAGTTATIKGAQLADATAPKGFISAKNTGDVNIQTGIYNGTAFEAATYYITEEFYVASAGDAFNGSLTFTLRAPSVTVAAGDGANAYAAAVYVVTDKTDYLWADNAVIRADDARDPNAIIFIDSTEQRNTFSVNGVDVPSVVGALGTDANPAVGVKVVVRFYVDGALKDLNNKVQVDAGYIYSSATSYVAGGNYFKPVFTAVDQSTVEALDADAKVPFGWYTLNNGVYTNVTGAEVTETTYYTVTDAEQIVLTAEQQVVGATLPAGSYTRAMGKDSYEYTFVRTAAVPSGGTELEIVVTSAKSN